MADHDDQSIGTRTVRGMLWAYGSYVGGRLLVLASTALLARLLTPRDFGVVAVALTFMSLLDTVSDLGLSQALIVARPEEQRARAQTVFGWSVVLGGVLAAVTAALAPAAAAFFRQPQLLGLVPLLGVNFLVRSLGNTHAALARKQLDLRKVTIAELADVITRGVASIVLAALGFGAWSLVVGYVVGAAGSTIALWVLVDFRPRLRLTREHLRDLLGFGGMLTVVDILNVVVSVPDNLFVGRVLGPAALGLYTLGFRLPALLVIGVAIVAGGVLFPAYSALDRSRLQHGYLVALRYTSMLVFPLAAGLVVLAGPVILGVFGEQWRPSIPVMRIIAVYGLVVTLNIPPGTVYKVTRQAGILAALMVPHIALLVTMLLVFGDRGIVAVAGVMAGVQALAATVALAMASHRLRVPLSRIATTLAAPIAATLGMAACVVPVERAISAPWPALILGTLVGAVAYGALLWVLAPDVPRRLRESLLPRIGAGRLGRSPAVAPAEAPGRAGPVA